jgi:hypothetical protein
MTIKLPTEIVKAEKQSPSELIIFGKPKVGKTTALSLLDNCLIIDLEGGTKSLDAMKVYATDLKELKEIVIQISQSKHQYDYIAIDTLSKMEDWCEWEATETYMKSTIGKKFNKDNTGTMLPRKEWESVLSLPQGAGYYYVRQSMKQWIDRFKKISKNLIMVCHTKDKYITDLGKELVVNAIDLTGKLANIVCADAQAIGFLYVDRKSGDLMINFDTKQIEGGTRALHIAGQDFPLLQFEGKGTERKVVTNNWNKIYID